MAENGKTVLIAEDEHAVASALETKLTSEGFNVTVATDGEEALNMLKGGDFDILLMDLVMPNMDGFELLEKLQSEGSKIKTFILSNLSQPEDQKKTEELGAEKYFVKSNTSLAEIVKEVSNSI